MTGPANHPARLRRLPAPDVRAAEWDAAIAKASARAEDARNHHRPIRRAAVLHQRRGSS